ncbi:MAG: hypothetical protein QG670_1880 [Thermoproteota archaeon]|nr:hypothetical protein [Thermoproteota archaeon]
MLWTGFKPPLDPKMLILVESSAQAHQLNMRSSLICTLFLNFPHLSLEKLFLKQPAEEINHDISNILAHLNCLAFLRFEVAPLQLIISLPNSSTPFLLLIGVLRQEGRIPRPLRTFFGRPPRRSLPDRPHTPKNVNDDIVKASRQDLIEDFSINNRFPPFIMRYSQLFSGENPDKHPL